MVKNEEQPENPEKSTALLPKSEMSRATKNLVMKKIIIALAFLLPFTLTAQQHSGKISFFYQAGYLSAGYINKSGQNEIATMKEAQPHKCIIFNVGFLMRLSEKWRMGPAFTYDHFGTKQRTGEHSNLSYMVRSDRIWKETKTYLFYSGLSLGVRKIRRFEDKTEIESSLIPAFQVYLMGVEFKVARFSFDVNAGWGVAGILDAGVKYRF